nr:hypothetical protein [Tanacetum cinerariifolium]
DVAGGIVGGVELLVVQRRAIAFLDAVVRIRQLHLRIGARHQEAEAVAMIANQRVEVRIELLGLVAIGALGRGREREAVLEIERTPRFAVEQRRHLRQTADVDRRTLARIAADLHARDALQRVGDGDVGQLADVFGRDRIGDRRGVALEVDGALLGATDTG